jgi:hypothetical protein
MSLILNINEILFNMRSFFKNFFKDVKQLDKLEEAYTSTSEPQKLYANGHFTYKFNSILHPNENVSTNKTHSPVIIAKNEEGGVNKIELKGAFNPNLKGENKTDYLTPNYKLDEKTTIIKEFPKNMVEKVNQFGKNAYAFTINNKDEKLLNSENGKFLMKKDAPTVSNYSKECGISIYDQIKACDEFERANKDYLLTFQGKQNYEIFKKYQQQNPGKNVFKDNFFSDND